MRDILDVISSRKSIRRYKPDPIPDEMIDKILEAARWAPTGENYQPWRFIVEAMNRCGRMQLRLQQAVEGLSLGVITYYGVALVGVLAKAAKAAGLDWNPDVVMGIAVPVVAALVFGGVHRVRKALEVKEGGA